VPVHRVFGDLSIDSRRVASYTLMPPRIRHRQLLDPRSLREALAMRRDEESLMPIAGCTDVYVSLNFGTLKQTRFLNLWRLKELRPLAKLAAARFSIAAR
jgi:hypothetical protein